MAEWTDEDAAEGPSERDLALHDEFLQAWWAGARPQLEDYVGRATGNWKSVEAVGPVPAACFRRATRRLVRYGDAARQSDRVVIGDGDDARPRAQVRRQGRRERGGESGHGRGARENEDLVPRFYAAFAARAKRDARRTAETARRLSRRRDAARRRVRHRDAARRAESMSR